MRLPYIILLMLILQGCGTVDRAIKEYYAVQDEIRIGDTKEKVLSLLEPGQSKLSVRNKKPPMRFTREGISMMFIMCDQGEFPIVKRRMMN